jgi:hypothetical protein
MEEEDPEFYKSFASYTQNDISQIDFVIQYLQFIQTDVKYVKYAYEFFQVNSLIPLGKELFPLISNTLKNAAESGNSFCDNVTPP